MKKITFGRRKTRLPKDQKIKDAIHMYGWDQIKRKETHGTETVNTRTTS
jgi:hypothetical protein